MLSPKHLEFYDVLVSFPMTHAATFEEKLAGSGKFCDFFRIDRMDQVEITEEERVPEPEGFNPQDYSDRVFHMYDGTGTMVTLRCRNELIDQVIDRFGTKISPLKHSHPCGKIVLQGSGGE